MKSGDGGGGGGSAWSERRKLRANEPPYGATKKGEKLLLIFPLSCSFVRFKSRLERKRLLRRATQGY